MSQVIPPVMGAIGGLIVMLVAVQLGVPGTVTVALWVFSTAGISVGWALSDQFPNGGGPF